MARGTSATHPYFRTLVDSGQDQHPVDLADAMHFLCLLHGRAPDPIETAAQHNVDPAAKAWLNRTSPAFAGERALITRLTVAAGPIASTPGQDQCTQAILQLRSALTNLAQSDRNGCALGAALAIAIDWWNIRTLLDPLSQRLGVEAPECALPSPEDSLSLAQEMTKDQLVGRALSFGGAQMLQQHRLFWDMLAARQARRR